MFKLKRLSADGIPHALDRAERYRLLNQPDLAESICIDVLDVDPKNQRAIVMLLLALTDRRGGSFAVDEGQLNILIERLEDPYEKLYYSGLISERQGTIALHQKGSHANHSAYEHLEKAMTYYQQAEAIRTVGNDDPILRWNTCARIIMQNQLTPLPREQKRS